MALLERSAVDARPANGCFACTTGHDRFTGAGRVDQTAAIELLAQGEPPRDRYEPNDAAGTSAYPLFGARREFEATLDYWNDRDDVYRVYLRDGERLVATATAPRSALPTLALWRPGTEAVDAASVPLGRLTTQPPGAALRYRARAAGWYFLHVHAPRATVGEYRLAVSKPR